MPIYERETKLRGLVYDVVVRQDGKKIWKRGIAPSKGQNPRREAEAVERRLLTEKEKGGMLSQSGERVADYLEGWLESYARTLGDSTYKTYCANLRNHVIPGTCLCARKPKAKRAPHLSLYDFEGEKQCPAWRYENNGVALKKLRDLRAADIQTCYGLITRRRSLKTALNVHRVLKEALGHAVRLEKVARNACDSVISPNPPPARVVPPSRAALDRIMAAADKTQYGRPTRLGVYTALRQSELIELTWDDVDLAESTLYVRKAKWGSAGAVVLPPEAVDMLIAHRVEQRAKRDELAKVSPELAAEFNPGNHVFINQANKKMDAGGLKRAWKRIKKEAKADFTFHTATRHMHASMLIKANVHAKVIQERLRHRNISTTMDIYGHLMPGLQAAAAQSISDAMGREEEER